MIEYKFDFAFLESGASSNQLKLISKFFKFLLSGELTDSEGVNQEKARG